jgi:tetratricopeptide (TPR) repeat protein
MRCFDRAKQLDDGTLSESIRLALIRVAVAQGRYDEALWAFLATPNLQYRPTELAGLGTLYRKMGSFQKARETYRACLAIDIDYHSAHAGLAEIRKQIGKPHQAIAAYNALFRKCDDLEPGARKVYSLAVSHLLRMTGQFAKAEQHLARLAIEFPADADVHQQFAKLLALLGRFDEARQHFERSKRTAVLDLGQMVFVKAMNRFDPSFVGSRTTEISPLLMPEEQGIAKCIEAYDLIGRGEFNAADEVLSGTSIVDRLAKDLACVLRYHAQGQMRGAFSYKSDYALCRIAKRSDRALRLATHAISSGDYATADRLESEFMLRLVA